MTAKTYKASLSKGRNSWCVIFRHPARIGNNGKPGLRVRRGLGTADDIEAKSLVDEYNALLSDEAYWKVSAKERAARQFDERVIKGFYEQIESKAEEDPWAKRENVLPLPGKEEGFARVLLIGATGAGKTTLLRRFIGTDPHKERFPSTSTARTTIFDTEIILSPGPYRCVVSFLSQDIVRMYVEECVSAAVTAAAENRPLDDIANSLLEHSELRFRLKYLLGSYPKEEHMDELLDDIEDEIDVEGFAVSDESTAVTAAQRTAMDETLRRFVDEVKTVGTRQREKIDELRDKIAKELNEDPSKLPEMDHDTLMELVEDEFSEEEDREAETLVNRIMDEIESRFSTLTDGTFEPTGNDWPETCEYETDDREDFIRTVSRFSSNYAPSFGRLLAPVVQGMRVEAPFGPGVLEEDEAIPQLVFMDGEGLGHVTATSSSLPTSLTRRYGMVDVILLVDNAEQPALASFQSVLRSVATSGNESKLAIAFTHFDQVKGVNFVDQASKRSHILASLEQVLRDVDEAVGAGVGRRLKRRLDGRVFFLSRIEEEANPKLEATKKSLADLIEIFSGSVEPVERPMATPVYDLANLVLCVRSASSMFQQDQNARLGVGHWQTFKALSRRFAFQSADHFKELKPVADLIRMLTERMGVFITNPREWEPAYPTEEEMESAIDLVAQEFYRRLHDAVPSRLSSDHLHEWGTAYAYRGTGSTRLRARDIRGIYEAAAPVPDEAPYANELLDMIRTIFREAAEAAGAKVIG